MRFRSKPRTNWLDSMARLILTLLGWERPDYDVVDKMSRAGVKVILFSHTSHWDTLLSTLYLWGHPILRQNTQILVRPEVHRNWPMCRMFYSSIRTRRSGHGPMSGHGSISGGGTVKALVVRHLLNQHLNLMLSPKGSRDNVEWKTGYYNLAVDLQANLIVGGLDYERKRLILGPIRPIRDGFGSAKTREDIEPQLKSDMAQVVPLHPNGYELRDYDPRKVGWLADSTHSVLIWLLLSTVVISVYYSLTRLL